MTRPSPKDMSASVSARLLQYARASGEVYQYVLMRFGLERLMYRMAESRHADKFIVKGAVMFLVWTGESYRPTKDLDLMAPKTISPAGLKSVFDELCCISVPDDGLKFLADSVHVEEIREDNVYGGLRVTAQARLGDKKIPIHVDIGFGDAVTPKAHKEKFPVLLDFPAPVLPAYPRETVIAEKFETMVRRGIINSRMKDYYDVWVIIQQFNFNGQVLCDAVRATFQQRKTGLPAETPLGLTPAFASDPLKLNQWRAFVSRIRLKQKPPDLRAVVDAIRDFIMPPTLAANANKPFNRRWAEGGPWELSGP